MHAVSYSTDYFYVQVVSILTDILKECRDIQQTHLLKGTGGQQTPPTIDTSASIAAQMRLIMDLQFKVSEHFRIIIDIT